MSLWALCALVGALGACGGLFLPAYSIMTPATLPDEALQSGNALTLASLQLAALAGPLLAGLVSARFTPSVAIGLDALSFLASALTLAALRDPRAASQPPAPLARQSQPGGAAAPETSRATQHRAKPSFWRFLRGSQLLQVILVVVVVANLPVEGLKGVALPALAFRELHLGTTGFGLMLAAFGAGGLIGSLAAAALPPLPRRGMLMLLLLAGDALAVGALPLAGGAVGAAICLIVWGLTNNLRDALYFTFIQQRLPRELLGRVMGVLLFATYSVAPLSALVIGAAVTRFGPVVVFPAGGAVLLLAVVVGLIPPEIREE
jgi:predicted MFS family arabinose efflux permease